MIRRKLIALISAAILVLSAPVWAQTPQQPPEPPALAVTLSAHDYQTIVSTLAQFPAKDVFNALAILVSAQQAAQKTKSVATKAAAPLLPKK